MEDLVVTRVAPAYLTYACDDLATDRYYALSLSERGLLDAMRRACWASADLGVPADPLALAVAVRSTVAEVAPALTPAVLRWFDAKDGKLFEPDLQRQLAESLARFGPPDL